MKKSEKKRDPEESENLENFDFRQGMGILPDDIPLTKNIGCAGVKNNKPSKSTDKL